MQEAAPAYRGFEIERHEMTIRTATAAEIRAYWRDMLGTIDKGDFI